MTATTADPAVAPRPSRFSHTLSSEWAKLRSVRSTYVTLGIGVFLSVAISALLAVVVGNTFDEWTPAQQADFEPIMFSLSGIIIALISFSVFGVLVVAGEYGSGMIRLTFQVTPRRGRVLWAKVLLVVIVLVPLGILTTAAMFLVGQVIFDSYDMATTSLGDPDALRAVIGVGAVMPFFPLIGLALGFLLRSTAAAITGVLAIVWVPEIFGGLLPLWWREQVMSRLPGASVDSFTIGHIVDSATYPEPALGAAQTAAWLALFLGAAWLLLVRRDA